MGRLSQLTQAGAARVVREVGGYPQESYNRRDTSILVVGALKPNSPKPLALGEAEHNPWVTIMPESDFWELIPADVLARHHRSKGQPPPPDLSRFRSQVADTAEAYSRQCVQMFISDDLPGQKAIEIDDYRDPAFMRLAKLVAEVALSVPKNSPVITEIRETLASHNLRLVIGNTTSIAPGYEYGVLRLRVLDKRQFLIDAYKFIQAGQV